MIKIVFFLAMFSSSAYATLGRRVGKIEYHHASAGLATSAAINAIDVPRSLVGWRVCLDAGSAADYLAISEGADPEVDGMRIAAGSCYECDDCGAQALKNLNVKASAAATGYSVIKFK